MCAIVIAELPQAPMLPLHDLGLLKVGLTAYLMDHMDRNSTRARDISQHLQAIELREGGKVAVDGADASVHLYPKPFFFVAYCGVKKGPTLGKQGSIGSPLPRSSGTPPRPACEETRESDAGCPRCHKAP